MLVVVACQQVTPKDAESARAGTADRAEAQQDTIADLIQLRVPEAAAGDSGWQYTRRANADLDGDGKPESVVLIADVTLDKRGRAVFEDGHRWQVYVEDAQARRTRIYARFLPQGTLSVSVAQPVGGVRPTIILLEQQPDRVGVYEVRYVSAGKFDVWKRLERQLDPSSQLQ